MEKEPQEQKEAFELWFFKEFGIPIEWAHGLLRMAGPIGDTWRMRIDYKIYQYEKLEEHDEQLPAE